jgi:hypothetical protein
MQTRVKKKVQQFSAEQNGDQKDQTSKGKASADTPEV